MAHTTTFLLPWQAISPIRRDRVLLGYGLHGPGKRDGLIVGKERLFLPKPPAEPAQPIDGSGFARFSKSRMLLLLVSYPITPQQLVIFDAEVL